MKLGVIIPVHDREENIEKTIRCLSRQVYDPVHEVYLMVVNHGSTDKTLEVIEKSIRNYFPYPSYIKADRMTILRDGWSASLPRNAGVNRLMEKEPDLDGFYFLDSDILLPPNRIQYLIEDYEALKDPKRVIIGAYHYLKESQYIDTDDPLWYTHEARDYNQDVRWKSFEDHPVTELNTGIPFALSSFGGSIFIPRELFFKVGMYDTNLSAGVEDGAIGLSLLKAEATFSLDKELLGWHHWHEIKTDRTENLQENIDKLNLKHFGTTTPDYGILEATKETYKTWGFDWHDVLWERKVKEVLT